MDMIDVRAGASSQISPMRADRHIYRLVGGKPLNGTIRVSGAKNSVTKLLVASLLTPEPLVINQVPRILEVDILLEMLRDLGTRVDWLDRHTLRVETPEITTTTLSLSYSGVNRMPILLVGPLLHRAGEARVPLPGGCRIGERPIDYHVEALRRMGAEVTEHPDALTVRTTGLMASHVRLPFPSVGATETLLLSSVLARGTTVISNAAVEPEVMDLIHCLQRMGALVSVDVDRQITVEGVPGLRGARYTPISDRIEVVSFATAAVATKGRVRILGAAQGDVATFLNHLRKAGGEFECADEGITFFASRDLHAQHLETAVHPGFMTDWQHPMVVMLTQADGGSVIHETIYEDRFGYTAQLNEMGARISLSTACLGRAACRFRSQDHAHSALVMGPSRLRGAKLEIPDLRAGFAYVLAALIARGASEIRGTRYLERGYEDMVEKLRQVGADVETAPA